MGAQKTWAWIFGIVLIVIGLWGFASDSILGYFDVNPAHNVVHLVTGLLFVWAAWKGPAKTWNTWLGVIYILVGIVGFFGVLEFLAVNTADNWLHVAIGLVALLVGVIAKD
ncbi:MAG: DUF4383 domain-containing protein [Nanoarchaeota archaeon]